MTPRRPRRAGRLITARLPHRHPRARVVAHALRFFVFNITHTSHLKYLVTDRPTDRWLPTLARRRATQRAAHRPRFVANGANARGRVTRESLVALSTRARPVRSARPVVDEKRIHPNRVLCAFFDAVRASEACSRREHAREGETRCAKWNYTARARSDRAIGRKQTERWRRGLWDAGEVGAPRDVRARNRRRRRPGCPWIPTRWTRRGSRAR